MGEADRLGEATQRVWDTTLVLPVRFDGVVELPWGRWDEPSGVERNHPAWGETCESSRCVACGGHEGVEEDEVQDPLGDVLERAGDDESPI